MWSRSQTCAIDYLSINYYTFELTELSAVMNFFNPWACYLCSLTGCPPNFVLYRGNCYKYMDHWQSMNALESRGSDHLFYYMS